MAVRRFIVRRPGLGFALVLLMMGGTALASLWALRTVSVSDEQWMADVGEELLLIERLRANMYARTQATQTVLITRELTALDQLELLHLEFDRLMGQLRTRAHSEARLELLETLGNREMALRDAGAEALRLVRTGELSASYDFFNTWVLPLRSLVEETAAALAQSSAERMQTEQSDRKEVSDRRIRTITLLWLAGLAASLAVALLSGSGVRQFERELRASAAQADRRMRQLHAVLSASADRVLLLDRKLVLQFASAAALRGMGRSASEVVGRPVSLVSLMGDAAEQIQGDLQHVIGTGTSTHGQAFQTSASGYTCYDYEVWPVLDGGRVEAVVLSARDVTERWETEENLRDWSNRVVTTLESISDAFVAIDHDWRCTYANHEAERLFGRPRQEIEGRQMWELLPDAVDAPVEVVFRRSLEQSQRADLEEFIPSLGRWLEIHLFPSPNGLSVYFRDITDRKRVEAHQRLLSASGALLAGSLELDDVVRTSTRVPLTSLADFTIFWPQPEVGPEAPQFAHAEEAREPLLRDAVLGGPEWPPRREDEEGQTVPEIFKEVRSQDLDAWAHDLEQRKRLTALSIGSVMRIPLMAAGAEMGCLVLAREKASPAFDERDMILAEDFGSRVGMAVKTAWLYASARHAVRQREHVLAVVSHDLRSPLNALRLTAQQLERAADDKLDPVRVRRLGQRMRQAGDRMHRLIRDLLDMAAAQAGALRLERSTHRAMDIARYAAEMVQPIAEEKSLELRVTGDSRAFVHGDRERVLQILSNLLGNAIRYSPQGAPLVIQVEPLDGKVRFSVIDRGPGISPEQQRLLFREWKPGPVSGSEARDVAGGGGTGLGLSIARSLVMAHGGEIGLESEPGRGSTFFFTLPRVDPQARAEEAVPAAPTTGEEEAPTVH